MKYFISVLLSLLITYPLMAETPKYSGVVNWKVYTPYTPTKIRKLRSSVDERLNGLTYLNDIRVGTGLTPYTENVNLDNAAQNHADYLIYHNIFSHYEDNSSSPLYTGYYPWDRGTHEGYSYKHYGENLSAGDSDIYEAIDGLMTAIYHRFGFLDFNNNELGIGSDFDSNYDYGSVYNFDMGNQTTTVNTQLQYILWPHKDYKKFQTSFGNTESPDPVPECPRGGITGNPISIEFNSAQNDTITMNSFKLFKEDGTEITNVKDPSSVSDLNDNQFVLFPMTSLSLDSKYRAEFNYTENSIVKSISWNFATRRYEFKHYEVTDGNSYNVISGETYLIQLKHTDCNFVLSNWGWTGNATIEYISSDLFKIIVTSDTTLNFNSNAFTIDFKISSTDNAISPSSQTDMLDLYMMAILPSITAYKKANP